MRAVNTTTLPLIALLASVLLSGARSHASGVVDIATVDGRRADFLRTTDATSVPTGSCATCVVLAPHGDPENIVVDRDGGYYAVRFDPPFDPPYSITSISFPSFTYNGVPAVFPSVRLCPAGPSGFPLLASPLFIQSPYEGSADGINNLPVNVTITDERSTFFVVFEFPVRGPSYPNDQPFVRADMLDMEKGFFAAMYGISPGGFPSFGGPNLVVDMTCDVGNSGRIPIQAPSNLGANRLVETTEFTFRPPSDETVNGLPLPGHSLRRTELFYRGEFGTWRPVATVGPGRSTFHIDSLPPGYWAAQAVDRSGNRSQMSNVEITLPFVLIAPPGGWGPEEPNGRFNEAQPINPTIDGTDAGTDASIFPTADRDYYKFEAHPGDDIRIWALPSPARSPGTDQINLAAALYDGAQRLLVFDDNSLGGTAPKISYHVPQRAGKGGSDTIKLTLEIFDVRGSAFSPETNRRSGIPHAYQYFVEIKPVSAGSARVSASDLRTEPPRPGLRIISRSGSSVQFLISLASNREPSTQSLAVLDVHGRLVRRLTLTGSGSPQTVVWDGMDSRGKRAAAGIYFARLDATTGQLTIKFPLVR